MDITAIWQAWQGMIGLLVGTIVMVLMPWFRVSLEAVAETGDLKSWVKFDWRYLALFFLPVLEFGVSFLTVEGLFEQAQTWKFVNGALLAYSGTHLGKESVKLVAAGYKIAEIRVKKAVIRAMGRTR